MWWGVAWVRNCLIGTNCEQFWCLVSTTWCCGHCKQVRGRLVWCLVALYNCPDDADQWPVSTESFKQQTPAPGIIGQKSERDEWVRVRPAIITTRVGLWQQWEQSSRTWASYWSVKPSQPRACPLIGREDARPESERVLLSSLARVTCDDLRPGIILSLTLGFWLRIAQRGRGIKGKVKTFILNIY